MITLTTHPAISLPCGTDPMGMPFGLQVVGRFRGDLELLSASRAMEQAFAASYRRPPGCAEAATLECANHYIRAKRAFEAQYAREQAKPRTASAP